MLEAANEMGGGESSKSTMVWTHMEKSPDCMAGNVVTATLFLMVKVIRSPTESFKRLPVT